MKSSLARNTKITIKKISLDLSLEVESSGIRKFVDFLRSFNSNSAPVDWLIHFYGHKEEIGVTGRKHDGTTNFNNGYIMGKAVNSERNEDFLEEKNGTNENGKLIGMVEDESFISEN